MVVSTLVRKIFGSRNERYLKQLQKIVAKINSLESLMLKMPDQAFSQKTVEFKSRLAEGAQLDDILVEVFAVVREVARRSLNMRHFDVQLLGGIILHEGKVVEMRTGEGKTLVSTLPAYLNALQGQGVHIVTVNDYLAKRDAQWMKPIYDFLGLSVGVISHNMPRAEKQKAYNADITYGTNNEFGFDYLRDNMVFSFEERMQRSLQFAIIDEVDSILIDEARTPLIISGSSQDSSDLYIKVNKIIPKLTLQTEQDGPGDFAIDEKNKQAFFTENGYSKVEQLLIEEKILSADDSLYAPKNINLMHHLNAAVKAHNLFKRDVDYIVKDNKIVIIDEHTGRTMAGRRWAEGLHQAVEAKEEVMIESENQTLASITFQNYFRLYNKLSGMTGTADTEAFELQHIYDLEVVVIPTNKPSNRNDLPDAVYLTIEEKFAAIIENIKKCIKNNQPVLVGTASIETSEYLSSLLKKKNIKHNVLNAKYHAKEASIIAEAGRPGTITIATNMAGRGTDIVLGGNLETELRQLDNPCAEDIANVKKAWQNRHKQVIRAGGLYVIGTERHESRRIDNQLRGRSGRQGDPGSTRFYLSVRDNLMRIFISEKIFTMLSKLDMKDDEPISHPWLTRAIENAQRKVEGHNFDVRKQLLEFDDVANDQRKVIYQQRNELMAATDISIIIDNIQSDVIKLIVAEFLPPQSLAEQWDISGLTNYLLAEFGLQVDLVNFLEKREYLEEESVIKEINTIFKSNLQQQAEKLGIENLHRIEKSLMLSILDMQWKEHLATMEQLRQSIHLRGYAQKDPKQEYKRESFYLFSQLLESIKREVIKALHILKIDDVSTKLEDMPTDNNSNLEFRHTKAESLPNEIPDSKENIQPYTRITPKVGRNALCPCDSGKKYKHCHGRIK